MTISAPFFSIITTSYNYGAYIGSTIESVLAQSEGDWELLVIDDGSSDHSWDVIQGYCDPRIHAVRNEENKGACASYNHMLARCRGRFIASLDSDDQFAPERLRRQRAYLEQHSEVDVCGTWLEEIDASGAIVPAQELLYAPWFNQALDLNQPERWIWQNRLCHSSAVVRKDVHDRIGPFREDLVYTPDWNFWVRCLVGGARFSVIHEPLTRYRNHGSNITHRNPLETVNEYARFSAELFHPYLLQLGRHDLVLQNLNAFIANHAVQRMPAPARATLLEHVVGRLNPSDAGPVIRLACERLEQACQDTQRAQCAQERNAVELAVQVQRTQELERAMADTHRAAEERLAQATRETEQERVEVQRLRAEVAGYRRLWETVPGPVRWMVRRYCSANP